MDYKDINDYEIMYMISENDEASVNLLFKKYKPFIEQKIRKWNTIFSKFGIEQEEIKQEVYVSFTQAVRSYSESCETLFYTYFNFVIDCNMKNYFKKNVLKKTDILCSISLFEPVQGDCTFLDLIGDPNSFDPQDISTTKEISKLCLDFSLSLSMDQSTILELYVSGYKISEIATLTEKNANYISVALHRILKNLKKYLVKNDYLVV